MTIILFTIGLIPLWYLVLTFLGWALISGLGVAVGYHRVFSHNTHPELPVWKENMLLLLGTLSGQGSSLTWVAIHRNHHKFSDKDERDLHSPVVFSPWHAFFGWGTSITENQPTIKLRLAGRYLRKANHMWFHENQLVIFWLVPIVAIIINWQVGLSLFVLPMFLGLMQDNLVNVFGHLKCGIGYRNFETDDNSHNNPIFGYLGWGQGWHNNHHAFPTEYDFGKKISGKWWEFDPCVIFLPFLKG